MQARNNQIEQMRKTLKLAKTDVQSWTDSFISDLIDALSIIGKEKIYELSEEVYALLNCPEENIRDMIVTTLGSITCLHLPEFKEKAYKIWLEDEDENVRRAALDAWASYYYDTRDPEVLKILYKILIDQNYSVRERLEAMQDIFSVSQEPSNFYDPYLCKDFYFIDSHEEFNQKVDWNEIKAIMKKYAPDALS